MFDPSAPHSLQQVASTTGIYLRNPSVLHLVGMLDLLVLLRSAWITRVYCFFPGDGLATAREELFNHTARHTANAPECTQWKEGHAHMECNLYAYAILAPRWVLRHSISGSPLLVTTFFHTTSHVCASVLHQPQYGHSIASARQHVDPCKPFCSCSPHRMYTSATSDTLAIICATQMNGVHSDRGIGLMGIVFMGKAPDLVCSTSVTCIDSGAHVCLVAAVAQHDAYNGNLHTVLSAYAALCFSFAQNLCISITLLSLACTNQRIPIPIQSSLHFSSIHMWIN